MSHNINDLYRKEDDLKLEREETIHIINDARSSDYEYNRAKQNLPLIERELDEVGIAIDDEERLNSNIRNHQHHRETDRGGRGSFAQDRFGGRSGNRGRGNNDEGLGNIRIKDGKNNRADTHNREDGRGSSRVPFDTKVAATVNLPFAISSLYPYIISNGVTIKVEAGQKFRDRVLYGVSLDETKLSLKAIELEEGTTPEPLTLFSKNKEELPYLVASSVIYSGNAGNLQDSENGLTSVLGDNNTLERTFGLPASVGPYINDYVCDLLNDALVLSEKNTIIRSMYDFKELLEQFTTVKTSVLKDIKKCADSVKITVADKEVSIHIEQPVVYGFTILEDAIAELKDETGTVFVSEDSNPAIFTALKELSVETDSNVICIQTTNGKKLRAIIGEKKLIVRKDDSSF